MEALVNINELTGNYVTEVKRAAILPSELMGRVESMLPELTHNIKTMNIWRTETEIRCSVLNEKDFPDRAAKYHQAKLEQSVFFDQLLNLSFEYRKKQQQLDIKESEIEEIEDKLSDETLKKYQIKRLNAELNIKQIEHQELAYNLQTMQIQAKDRVRELEIWSNIKKELDDGSFNKDSKDINQLISMTRRFAQEAFNVLNSGRQMGGDTAGFNNIVSQFFSFGKECIARGIYEEAISYFGVGSDIYKWAKQVFGLV